jgi:undecaprenyl diphosphate synthase
VYAFSVDNFKRPQEEVDALMSLAEKALLELCSHGYVCVVVNIRSLRSGVENQPNLLRAVVGSSPSTEYG